MSIFTNFLKSKSAKKKKSSKQDICLKPETQVIESHTLPHPFKIKKVDDFCPFDKADTCSIVSRMKDDLAQIQALTKTGSWKLNIQTQELEWSDQTYEIFERNKKFPVTLNTFIGYIHDDDREQFKKTLDNVLLNGGTYDVVHRIVTSNNNVKWVRERTVINSPSSIQNNCVFGTIQDITERKINEDSLKRMSTIFKAGEEGSVITDPNGTILDVNQAFCRVTGYTAEEAIGKNPKMLKSGIQSTEFYKNMWAKIKADGTWSGEVWNKKKNGDIYPEYLRIYSIKDENENIVNYVSLFSDISETKKHIDQMQFMAYHDALTGLPNRTKLGKEITRALVNADKNNQLCVIAYLDLDGFKPVNDKYGHNIGDLLLKDVAARISSCIRGHDLCARIGGDEFVLLLTEVQNDNEVESALARMCNTITKPYIVDGNNISVTASIGVTIYPYDLNDPDTLLRHADMAMYGAKQNGKNQIKIFDSSNELFQVTKKKIRDDLEMAIRQNHLELYWQPYFDITTNEIIGAEALLRWNFNQDVLSPSEFLYAIEHDTLSVDVGNYVLEQTFMVLSRLIDLDIDISLSVNLFQKQLTNSDFETYVLSLMNKYPNVPPKNIAFEILETTAIDDFEHVNNLIDRFSELGIKFGIDDFGTGYSSLSYFSKLHAQIIKIDRSFITNLSSDGPDHAIVNSIINLGQNFNKILIAEGVETEEQKQILQTLGCKIGQGYLFSKPIAYSEFENLLLRQF